MKTLHKGQESGDVKILQDLLDIPADGKFGPQTERAVRDFQEKAGLAIDGIVGPATWALMLGEKDCKYTYKQIEKAVRKKGYKWFTNHLELNIVGVRNSETEGRVTNHYDDVMTVSYNSVGEQRFDCFPITSDPGMHWIDHPMNRDGCAILVPGQYINVYKIDYHRKKYEALCQRAGRVKVFRDGNKDDQYDYDADTITEGYYGINIHRSSAYRTTSYVNKYSAGCQVFSDPDHFDDFMETVKKSRDMGGNILFTYTLIESKDIV